ncbi:MAG: hypothetical protein CMM01_15795 [Rhodopirellula sp.]|nr:hypothetical protein [Rhodopirellula sp.]
MPMEPIHRWFDPALRRTMGIVANSLKLGSSQLGNSCMGRFNSGKTAGMQRLARCSSLICLTDWAAPTLANR